MGKKKKSDHDRLEEYAGEKRWCVAQPGVAFALPRVLAVLAQVHTTHCPIAREQTCARRPL